MSCDQKIISERSASWSVLDCTESCESIPSVFARDGGQPPHPMSESRLYTHERSRLATIQSSSSVLRSASLAPTTISAYTQAVSRFSSYCKSLPSHSHHGFPHRAAAVDLDMCVSGYISLLYSHARGANRQLAVNTLYGQIGRAHV